VCGRCIEVTGPKGSVVLTVADKCPSNECVKGSIDIAENAFTRIAEKDTGRVKVQWREVTCGAQPSGAGAAGANTNNQTIANTGNAPAAPVLPTPGNINNNVPGISGVVANAAPKVNIFAAGILILLAASVTFLQL
jgi:rare lipoprotein A (peptidoglycan hydrolase)